MNLLDSELVVAKLRNDGYELTDDLNQADLVLYNTCSVRQHAEDKIYSALGRIKRLKERKPGLSIGVLGCMAQKDQEQIFRRAPHVDVVVGPGQLAKVGELVERSREENTRQIAVSLARSDGSLEVIAASFEGYDADREPALRPTPFQAFVRVMMGCDKFCTYCIVPVGSRAGAEPSAGGDPRRSSRAGGAGGQGDHAPRPDGQQLQVPRGRWPGRPTLGPARARCTMSRGSSGSSSSPTFPNDMTDDLLAGGARSSQGLPLHPRAGAERLRPGPRSA